MKESGWVIEQETSQEKPVGNVGLITKKFQLDRWFRDLLPQRYESE